MNIYLHKLIGCYHGCCGMAKTPTTAIARVHVLRKYIRIFNLQKEDNLSIKDTLTGSMCPLFGGSTIYNRKKLRSLYVYSTTVAEVTPNLQQCVEDRDGLTQQTEPIVIAEVGDSH